MTDAEHAAVLRRMVFDANNAGAYFYLPDIEQAAIERAIELLNQGAMMKLKTETHTPLEVNAHYALLAYEAAAMAYGKDDPRTQKLLDNWVDVNFERLCELAS